MCRFPLKLRWSSHVYTALGEENELNTCAFVSFGLNFCMPSVVQVKSEVSEVVLLPYGRKEYNVRVGCTSIVRTSDAKAPSNIAHGSGRSHYSSGAI